MLKESRGVGSNPPPINGSQGQSLLNDKSKADEFQRKFMSVFGESNVSTRAWSNNAEVTEVDLSPSRVRTKIFQMNGKAAAGLDTLGMNLYKEAPFKVFEALSLIFQCCFNTGVLPDDWVLAKVTPIWKNAGSKSDIAKYRPVSISIAAFKILEAMFSDNIEKAAEILDFFGDEQHGFRGGRSTVTNLTSYWDTITRLVDQNKRVYVINLDMSRAFDTLDIEYLLDSLEMVGVGGSLGCLLKNWLKGRFQCVEVGNSRLGLERVGSGIQQGSLTGPCLFNIAASRITAGLRGRGLRFLQYADDLKVIFEVNNEDEMNAVQEALDEMVAEANKAGLAFNASKSSLLAFGGWDIGRYPVQVRIGDGMVERVKEAKDLGLTFQSNLSFSSTLASNLKKAMAIVHIIRTTIKVRTISLLRQLYEAYFLPIITYGSEVFVSEMSMVKSSMLKGYRAFWRLAGNKFPLPDDLLDPYQICVIKSMGMFKRIQMNKTCFTFGNLFSFNENGSTRSSIQQDLEVGLARKKGRFNFFSNMCSHWFNALTPEVRNSGGLSAFKQDVIQMVKSKYPTPPCDLRPRYVIWQESQSA